MKSVMIVTDLHLTDCNTVTQPRKLEEQAQIMKKLVELARENKEKYEESYIVLLGDIANRTLSDQTFAEVVLFFNDLDVLSNGIYTVIGNHELTYRQKGNVFWSIGFGSKMPSNKFKTIREIVRVEDSLKVDNTVFKMWHYGTQLTEEDLTEEDLLILGHNAIKLDGMKEIYEFRGMNMQDKYINYNNIWDIVKNKKNLRGIFTGHMHTLVGKFNIKEGQGEDSCEFFIENLGSLMRPNNLEFDITCDRNIPVVEIDGGIMSIRNNIIKLSDRSSLNEEEIAIQRENYKNKKYIKELRETVGIRNNAVEELEKYYMNDLYRLNSLHNALSDTVEQDLNELITKLEKAIIYV